jgi:hypothetical protein
MRMMILGGVMLAALAAAPAAADSISQTRDLTGPLVFNQFDPTLGTLDGVTFFSQSDVPLIIQVTSNLPGPVLVAGNGSAGIGLTGPSGSAAGFSGRSAATVFIQPGTNSYLFAVHNVGVGQSDAVGGDLSGYVGTGTFTLGVAYGGSVTFTQFLSTTLSAGPATAGFVTLEYLYTAVPEPPSLALGLLALAAWAAWWARAR